MGSFVNRRTKFSPTVLSIRRLGMVTILFLLCSHIARGTTERRPNFVFMLTDDLGFGDLKSYGHPYAITDNLDRLAREGTAFRYFHMTGNICPNSRAGLMTSRNPSWFPNYTPDYGFGGALTVTKLLQDAGYVTGHIGKWNIGPKPSKSATSHEEYGIGHLRITSDGRSDPRGKEGERYDLAIEFVEQYRDVPFYLNVWMYAPHSPVEPPQYLIDAFDGLEVDRDLFGFYMQQKFDKIERLGGSINVGMQTYLGEVLGLDLQIGRLLNRLDELGLAENTIVVFSSDNGPAKIDHAVEINDGSSWAGRLRGGKHQFYEGGISVPFLVRWPGHVPAGKVNSRSFFSALDWLPTVGTLAEADIPWDLVEGEDVSDIWLGSDRSRRDPTFYQDPGSSRIAVHYGGWKMYDWEERLYDLIYERREFFNVYDESPEVVSAMKNLKEQYKATLPDGHRFGGDNPLSFDPMEPVRQYSIPDFLLQTPANAADTPEPTLTPTVKPSPLPTKSPTVKPSQGSTASPTAQPTPVPSASPTVAVSPTPTALPTSKPSHVPTASPTVAPSPGPSVSPSAEPSVVPSLSPSDEPSLWPSVSPSATPSSEPTVSPPKSEPEPLPANEPSSCEGLLMVWLTYIPLFSFLLTQIFVV